MSYLSRQRGYLRDAWLVILLALVFGGGLAGVQSALSDKIAENKKQETYSVIPELVSGADAAKTVELLIEGRNGKAARVYKVAASDGTHKGWVLPADGQGFADRVEVLIGLDATLSTITGLYVLDQKETPGLGDYITGESFRNGFQGKPTDGSLMVVKSDPQADNEVRALTGATISSESVAAIVNGTLANMKGPIQEQGASSSGDSGLAPAAPENRAD
jgi:electron transport complex protein RnfG